jgi:thioredoxin-related protein
MPRTNVRAAGPLGAVAVLIALAGPLFLALAAPGAAAAAPPAPTTTAAPPTTKAQPQTQSKTLAPSPTPAPGGSAGDVRIGWLELGPGLAEAKRAGRPILVDVYTDWCGWCKRMDRTTYADGEVMGIVGRNFVAVRLNAEDEKKSANYRGDDLSYREFADGFRITGYPTTLFLAADGSLITTVPGYVKPELFRHVLRFVGEGHYKTKTWDTYARDAGVDQP